MEKHEGPLVLGVSTSPADTDRPATGTWREFTLFDRVRRGSITAAIGIGGAAILLPVPGLHLGGLFVLLPGCLFVAFWQFRTASMLKSATGACPRCDTSQSFFTGLGLRAPRLPIRVTCANCHRESWLRNP